MAKLSLMMLLPVAVFAGFAGMAAWALMRDNPDVVPSVMVGREAPSVGATTLPGKTQLTDEMLRQPGVKLVNFWASWCPPCVEDMPVLDAYHRTQGADGVLVFGIALEDAADARAFLERVPVGFPIFAEPNSTRDSSVRLGNARGLLPYTVLIDPQGRLVAQHLSPFPDADGIADWVDQHRRSAP